MLDPKCRLCSSTCALISLFNGKCRKNRDFIRKIVEVTTGIKFEKGDAFKCICYTCTVQVYNCYIFRIRSKENEQLLEAHIKKDEKQKLNKFQIFNLEEIQEPEINELQNTLAPWLISKQNHCNLENNDDISSEKAPTNNVLSNALRTVETGTQCDNMQNLRGPIQDNTKKNVSSKSIQCAVPGIVKHTQTNGILVKSIEIQCCLESDEEKSSKDNKDCETQTDSNTLEKSTQFNEKYDYNCHFTGIKEEGQLPSPSPMYLPDISLSPIKNNLPSPISPNLLAVRKKSKNVIICKYCDQSLYSKMDYNIHKKTHLVCRYCKKKLTSLRQTTLHIQNDCVMKKIMDNEAVVQLVKLESNKGAWDKYSDSMERLKTSELKVRQTVRMRSRSTSSVDSIYSCCSLCRYPVSILHSLKLGVDKSVQTGLLFENGTVTSRVNGDVTPKTRFRSARRGPHPKRAKLSHSFTK